MSLQFIDIPHAKDKRKLQNFLKRNKSIFRLIDHKTFYTLDTINYWEKKHKIFLDIRNIYLNYLTPKEIYIAGELDFSSCKILIHPHSLFFLTNFRTNIPDYRLDIF